MWDLLNSRMTEDQEDPLAWRSPPPEASVPGWKGIMARIWWYLTYPLHAAYYRTIPDPRMPRFCTIYFSSVHFHL